jgi:hypothetical protein
LQDGFELARSIQKSPASTMKKNLLHDPTLDENALFDADF